MMLLAGSSVMAFPKRRNWCVRGTACILYDAGKPMSLGVDWARVDGAYGFLTVRVGRVYERRGDGSGRDGDRVSRLQSVTVS